MRILIVSLCSLALVSMVGGAQKQDKKSQPKKQAQTAQRAAQPTHASTGGASGKKASTATHQVQANRNGRAAIAASNNAQNNKKNQTSTAVNQGKRQSEVRLTMPLIKLRKTRRTKPKLRDKQPKLRIKRKKPRQQTRARAREQATRTRRKLATATATERRKMESSRRTSRLNRSTSILQNSRIPRGRRRKIPARETNSRKPKLAGTEIRSVSQLQIRMARSELVARSLR